MIDIAWSEFLFIALLALILIGPKELPSVLRGIGRWVGKARVFVKDVSAQLNLSEFLEAENEDHQNNKTFEAKKVPPKDPLT